MTKKVIANVERRTSNTGRILKSAYIHAGVIVVGLTLQGHEVVPIFRRLASFRKWVVLRYRSGATKGSRCLEMPRYFQHRCLDSMNWFDLCTVLMSMVHP